MADIDSAFEDETAEESVETDQPENNETAEDIDTDVDESEETSDESEETETEEVPEDSKESAAFRQAYQDEKRKRQRLEERLSELESLIPKQEEDLPDPYEDPEGYKEAIKAQARREVEEEANRTRMKRIEERRTELIENNEDFLQMEQIFDILSVRSPEVRKEMFESSDPVKYAYDKAKAYHDEVMRPEKVLTTEMPDESEFVGKAKQKGKPNLAKASAGASNKVIVEKEDGLGDVFADLKY